MTARSRTVPARTILVTDARRGTGRLVADALKVLGGADVVGLERLPRGPQGRQASGWLTAIEESGATALFVSNVRLRGDGVGRMAVEAAAGLFAAASRSDSLDKIVVMSSGQVYGAAGTHPTFVPEELRPPYSPGPSAEALVDIEDAALQFARRRPDVLVTVLRPAEVLGEEPFGLLADHVARSGIAVTSVLGYDPQVQFVTDHDVAKAALHALTHDVPGIFNVAPSDALPLSDAVRQCGRFRVGTTRWATIAGRLLGRTEAWSWELARLLRYGRALDSGAAIAAGFAEVAPSVSAVRGWAAVARL